MTGIQNLLTMVIGGIALFALVWGLYQTILKKKPYQTAPYLWILGIFVWGDAVVFALLWLLLLLLVYWKQDWRLFLISVSVFWAVRSLGETVYWLNQQFSPINRNPPEKLWGYKWIGNDAIWFMYQIFWQCITVVSLVCLFLILFD